MASHVVIDLLKADIKKSLPIEWEANDKKFSFVFEEAQTTKDNNFKKKSFGSNGKESCHKEKPSSELGQMNN